MFGQRIGNARPKRTAMMPRRRFVVPALIVLAALVLPISASGYISTGTGGDNSWSWQNPVPQGNTIYGLAFPSSSIGWAVGRSGVVLKTIDSGGSWQPQDTGTQNDLIGVAFADSSNGWVAGASGVVRHTADGGVSWTGQISGTSNNLSAISFADANRGVVVGASGTIKYTSNGGASWTSGTTTATVALNSVTMSSATQAWAVGAGGAILRSGDGGASWTTLASPVTVALNAVTCASGTNIAYAVGAPNGTATTILKTTDGVTWAPVATTPANSLTLYAVDCSADGSVVEVSGGSSGAVYSSADGGATWVTQRAASSSNSILRAINMPDSTHVYAAGDSGAMISSSNSGASWAWKMQGLAANMVASSFVSPTTGFAVGASGVIMKTTDGGASWTGMTATTNNLTGVTFLDANTGWAVGAAGTIIKTTDGGARWTAETSGIATALNAVWFTDANNGLAGGASGVLLRTTNGGATWSAVTSGASSSAINGIWFADANTGYLCAAGGKIGKTINGGATWTTARPTGMANVTLYGVRGTDANTVWACGASGTVAKTVNGGTSWTTLTSGTTQPLYGLFFANANRGWIGGAYGTVKTTADGGSTWTTQNAGMPTVTTETNVPARAFSFLDANNGFLVGDAGTLRRTTDGGVTWRPSLQGGILQLNSLTFTDANNGWLVGSTATIQRTTDGGKNWYALKTGVNSNLLGVAMADANNGWVVGASGAIRHTADGGLTWFAQTSGTTNQLDAVACANASSAIAGGVSGTMRYTTDGGATWTSATVPTAQTVNGVWMSSSGTGWAVANYNAATSRIMKTSDGGATWVGQTTTSTASFYGVQFLPDGLTGWAVGSAGTIVKTTNGGATWTVRPSGTAVTLYGVSFLDANNGCAVGASGVVLRTVDGGTTWTLQQSGSKYHNLRAVRFTDASHGWIVGDAGAILPTTVDSIPPVTTLAVSPATPNGSHGWYKSAPTLTLSRNELGVTYYSWVSTAGPFATYVAPVAAPEGAGSTINYYSTDLAGNTESVHSAVLNTDYTAPTTPAVVLSSGVTTSSASLSWALATDAGSGVDHYDVYLNGTYNSSSNTSSTVLTGLTPNTIYSVTVVAVDAAGLGSVPTSPLSVTTSDLDRTPLSTSISVAPPVPDGDSSWYVTVPTVTLTSSPATVTGTIHYSWDSASGPWTSYSVPISAPEGTHTLWYYATDNAGIRNDEAKHQFALATDTHPPTTPASVTPGTPGTSTVPITWAPSTDAGSGVNDYEVVLNGQLAATTASTSVSLQGLSPGIGYSVTVKAVDKAGLASAESTPAAFTTQQVDRSPLATVRTVVPALPDGENGWYIASPGVSLAALPSTVSATINYSWSSSAGPWSSYTSTLTPSDGIQTLWYYARDNSGVRDDETPHSVTLQSDLLPPQSPSGMIAGVPTTSTVVVSWADAFADAAPIVRYEVFLNGQYSQSVTTTSATLTGLTPNTSYSITAIAVDQAGRGSLPSVPALIQTPDLDRTPLVTTLTATPSTPDGLAGWYASAPTITLASSPTTVPADIYYSWSSSAGPWTPYGGGIVPTDGVKTLYYFSRDRTGQRNDEAVHSNSYSIDTAAPSTPGAVSATDVTFSSASVMWSPSTDAVSGVDHYQVLLNGSPYASTTSTGTSLTGLSETTTYTVAVVAYDVAGHASATGTGTFHTPTIDRTPLVTSAAVSPSSPDGSGGWYLSPPAVTLSSAPATVPATTYYSWGSSSGPWTQYSGEVLSPPEGASTLWFQSSDNAGYRNAETPKHADFRVDSIVPIAPDTVSTTTVGTSTASVSWSGETAGSSPIDHFGVYVNGVLKTTSVTHTANLTGLSPLTSYTITVVAFAQSGQYSDPSLGLAFTTADATPLVTSASPSPSAPNGSNGWYVTTPTVTLSATPTGPSYTYYAWNSSAISTYTAPVSPTSNGSVTLSFWSIDQARLRAQEATKQATYKVDTSSPNAPAIVSASGVSTSALSVTWSGASDSQSGIDHYDLWVGGAKYGTYTTTSATVTGLNVNSSYPVYVVTVNGAGLSSVSSNVFGHTLSNPAVSTSAAPNPPVPDGLAGWYVSAPTVSLTSLPSTVPAWTYAGWDGAAVTTYTPGFATPMPGDGTHTLHFLSVDKSDPANREATQAIVLRRDTVAPSAPTAVTPQSLDTSSFAVNWTLGYDSTSGVDHYVLYVDGAPNGSFVGTSTVVGGMSPNSLHSFAVAAVDTAGNTSLPTAPVWATTNALPALATSALVTPASPDGSNGWYTTTPTVGFSVTPAVPADTYFAWDASVPGTATGSVAMPSAGTHTLSFASVDRAGQRAREATQQLTLKLDTTAPSTATVSAFAASTTSISVSWTPAADAQSGIDHYDLYVNNAKYATYTGTTASVTGLQVNRPYDLRVVAVDGAGFSAGSDVVTVATLPDAPVHTDASVAPASPDGLAGWYVTAPLVTLTPQPPSVLSWTYFGWDGTSLAPFIEPIAVPGDGTHTLAYLSQDQADASNREATRTLTLNVDTTPPSPPASVAAQTLGTDSIGVSWTLGSDAASGIDHYELLVDGAPQATTSATGTTVAGLTPNSLHYFSVVAYDVAGHASDQSPIAWGSAAASPALLTAATASPSAPDGANGWYVTLPQITLTSTPASIPADTAFAWDSAETATYTAPVTAPGDGTHTLSFWSVDKAREHSQEATEQATYKIDTSAPTAPGDVTAASASTTSLEITWGASDDAQSGIDHYEIWVGGVKRATVSDTSATVSGLAVNRSYQVHVIAVDGAGLSTASADTTGTTGSNPAISTSSAVTPSNPDGDNGWYKAAPTVALTSSPAGVSADTFFAWDGSDLATYTAPVTVPSDGTHDLRFYSVDQADASNRDATSTVTLKLDSTPPSPPVTLNAVTVDTTSVALDWTLGSDATSGVDRYLVFLDGVQFASVSATGTTVSGLVPNTLHTFAVEAVDAAGNISAPGPSATAVTGALTALSTTAQLSPLSPDGLNGWYVTTPTVSFSVTPASIPANTYYSWDGATPAIATGPVPAPANGEHTLEYWSVDQAGQHSAEATQQLTVHVDTEPDVRTQAPGTPAGISATRGLVTDTSALLTWTPPADAPSGIDRYEIWDEYVGSTSGTSFLVSGLTPLSTYGYRVYAVNGAGTYFSQSDTVTVETSPSPRPQRPGVVLATAPDGGFVNVDWQPVSSFVGNMGYHVWRSSDGESFSQVATLTGQYSTYYTDEDLRSSTQYWYGVTSFDDRGESDMSDVSASTWEFTAPFTGRPDRVADLVATPSDNDVYLTWAPDDNLGVTSYVVTRADRSDGAETTITPYPIAAVASPSWDDSSAADGQTYYYRVYPIDASGTVGFGSVEVEAKPFAPYSGADIHVMKKDLTSSTCTSCHSPHAAAASVGAVSPDNKLLRVSAGPNIDPTCLRCHALGSQLASTDTSSEIGDPLNRSAIPMWTAQQDDAAMTCMSCHRALTSDSTPTAGLMSSGEQGLLGHGADAVGNSVCYSCHGAGSKLPLGDLTGFDQSLHNNVPSPQSGSQIKCEACHEAHASRNEHMLKYDGSMVCMQCHSGATGDPNQPDIWTRLTLNDSPSSEHPLLPQAQTNGARMSCENCHNTHVVSGTSPVVDPHNPSPSGAWTGNLNGDQKSFCFRCHDGAPLPTSAETTAWAGAVFGENGATTVTDIADAWSTNVHGLGVASDPDTATALLRPDMGYAVGDSLDCSVCHDPHGTTNDFGLLAEVKSADGTSKVSGVLVYKIPAGSITPTSPVGYDLRFFCSTCHKFDPATHDPMAHTDTTQFGKTDCTRCHRHVLTNGAPSDRL